MSTVRDVIVVGAGIIGCAIASELARRGQRVLVLDRRDVGQGATQASAGILAPYTEAEPHSPLLALAVRSLAEYPGFVAATVRDGGTPVPLSLPGTLEVTGDEERAARYGAWARTAPASVRREVLEGAALRAAEPQLADDLIAGLLIADQGYVAAGALNQALAAAAKARGAEFVPAALVEEVSQKAAGLVGVRASGAAYAAASVVLAAGSWAGEVRVTGATAPPVRPVRGQLLHLEWTGTPLGHVVWGPGCYMVPWSDGTTLVGATVEEAGFDERVTVAGARDLLEAASELVPAVWRAGFAGARVGLRPGTPDDLPIVGPSRRVPGVFYATGHYRNGVLLAPITARLVADLVVDGRSDPDLATVAPARFGDL